MDLVDDDRSRNWTPWIAVPKALVEVLIPAGPDGHTRAAQALLQWLGDGQVRPFALDSLVDAIRHDEVDPQTLQALRGWAREAVSQPGEYRQLAASALAQHTTDAAGEVDLVALRRALTTAPDAGVALALLRRNDLDVELLRDVASHLRELDRSAGRPSGWVSALQLLVLTVKYNPSSAEYLADRLRDPTISVTDKVSVLSQIAIAEPATAAAVIDEAVAAQVTSQMSDLDDHLFSRVDVHAWQRALALAGLMDESALLDWLLPLAAGLRHDRWQAAHALPTAAFSLGPTTSTLLLRTLLLDRDIGVAAEAARQTPDVLMRVEALSEATGDALVEDLHRLLGRDGVLGAMWAGWALRRLGRADEAATRLLRTHPSARVRAIAEIPIAVPDEQDE